MDGGPRRPQPARAHPEPVEGRPHRVLILGGGFGGVAVAQALERRVRGDQAVEVTLVSQHNYLLFLPMLPEAASGSIELTHILSPLRSLLRRTRIRVETVQSVDLEQRTATTVQASMHVEHTLEWDSLVLALGNVVSLAGMPGVAQHGLPIKTIGDALHIRNRAVEMLEGAATEADVLERRRMLTFVVAGGGFSGVETAAELNEFLRDAAREYRLLDPATVRVVLLHSGERLLPELSAGLSRFAQRHLERRDVEIRLGVRLASATAHAVALADGTKLDAHTLIVAIGSGMNPVLQAMGLPHVRGRIQVDDTLRVAGRGDVWALGDCAAVPDPRTGEPSPPTAQFALRQGSVVAHNVLAAIEGRSPARFTFRGLGQLVSLGRRSGVAEVLGTIRVSGLLAWLMWRGFYLFRLPGLERKVRVWLDWNLDLFFRRELAQLDVQRTERIALAHFEPGQTVFRQGDPADAFYVVVRGEVQIVRVDGAGQETELARLRQGESFGEVGLLRQQRRNATVRATEPLDVIQLERQDFHLLTSAWRHLGADLEQIARARESQPTAAPPFPASSATTSG